MSLTNEGELDVLNVYFKGGTPPSSFYVGLAHGEITDADTLSTITEVSDGGYSRQAITLSSPVTDAQGYGYVSNTNAIEFGPFEEAFTYDITYAFLTDAQSGTSGKLILYGQLDQSWKPPANGILRFPAGNFKFKLD